MFLFHFSTGFFHRCGEVGVEKEEGGYGGRYGGALPRTPQKGYALLNPMAYAAVESVKTLLSVASTCHAEGIYAGTFVPVHHEYSWCRVLTYG